MVTAGGIATAATAQQDQGEPDVSIDDQNTTGEEIRVSSVTPPEGGGFIALHEGSEDGPVIGTSEYIAEQDRNVRIQLDESLDSDVTVVAVLHEDTDGDQALDPSDDQRYRTDDGETVSDEAEVTVRGGGAGDDADAVDEEDDVTGDNVTDAEEQDNATDNVTDDEAAEEVDEGEDAVAEDDNVTNVTDDNVTDAVEPDNVTDEPADDVTDERGPPEDRPPVNLTERRAGGEAFEVTNLRAVEAAPINDTVTVMADIEADEDEQAEGFVEFRLDGEVVDRRHVNLSDDDYTVEFQVDTTGLEAGTYVHGVFTADSGEVAELTLVEQNESFEVTSLDAPENATVDENVTVNATITNAGAENDTQLVDARLDGDVVAQENVTLGAGEEENVSLNVTPEEEGTQYLSVFTKDDGEFQQINVTEAAEENETEAPTANVSFENQTSNGSTVVVDSVNSSNGTFVAIHDASLLEGNVIGSVVGVSDYLEQGEHENVSVELFNVSGADFAETELTENQTLIAMPHLDTNDNETYDFVATDGAEDGPYVNETGQPVVDDAFVTVEAVEDNVTNETNVTDNETNVTDNETNVTDNETNVTDNETNVTDNETNVTDNETNVTDNETNVTDNETNVTDNETNVTDGETNVTDNETNLTANETNATDNETEVAATASVEFNDQTTSGEVVGVASANLSEGGFVVIHDATLFDGEVFGSVIGTSEYLEPGEHDTVSVQLYDVPGLETNQTALEEDQTLIAMAHLDTDDNETYDFLTTDGEEDGAYVDDTGPVIDDANVTVESFDGNETTDANETSGTILG